MRKLNTEDFIIKSRVHHSDYYNYSLVEYVNQRSLVNIICPLHGVFAQKPELHLRGQGCNLCGNALKNKLRTDTYSSFRIKASEKHSNFYTYFSDSYVSNRIKMKIACPSHGIFEQTPEAHLTGRGCPSCGIESRVVIRSSNTLEFLTKCSELPIRDYDYSQVEYKSSLKPVVIICKQHGPFKQAPKLHLIGHGCPFCAEHGYKTKLPGILYILNCDDITKIGITNISAETRAKSVSKSSGKDFEVLLAIKFSEGKVADTLETGLLQIYRKSHKRVLEKFDGYSECFYDINYDELQKNIINLCSEFLPA